MAGLSTSVGVSFSISVYCARCERPIGLDELKERGGKKERRLRTADLKVSILVVKVPHDGRCVCGSDTFHIRRG